jgi:hypothetical protein
MTAILGVDPGGTTGIALLDGDGGAVLLQSTREGVLTAVEALFRRTVDQGSDVALAVERFVAGPRSGKLATPAGATIARALIGELTAWAKATDVVIYLRSAGEVKPWATDARLKAAGISHRGMPHALDAARHALFTGVKAYGMPDPLSRRGSDGSVS